MTATVKPILDLNAFRDDASAAPAGSLLARRRANFGAASVLFYSDPIEVVRGQGVWMEAADGRRYLDFYNNVPSVGHCHPRVVAAIAEQAATLNINTRYLNQRVESYLERLKATLPDEVSNAVLCCTGSEANDLALRVAAKASGGAGVVVTEAAYHGNTAAVTDISPSAWKLAGPVPAHVRIVPPPSAAAFGADIAQGFADAVAAAFADLQASGIRPSAFICDSIFSSDGVYADPPGFLAPAVAAARAAGALYIGDEVQPGFARTGDAMWGFARHGLVPDIVTMGKPMGNGFPMAALLTRPDLLALFCEDVGYFNTFGGNPVAAAAGLAVLEVIAEEGLQANALAIGGHLKARLAALAQRYPMVGAVRGAGLFIGIELVQPGDPATPDPAAATALIAGLHRRGVLIGAAGRYGNTLKVRPPLCLTRAEADLFADALAECLEELPTA
ncbi:MAG: aminotransferase class III-fold pyridoxal phosphate-dependent enzyme [Rhodospirillaceae bacterium]|nr:aminotransferase class III-fold pyridoxal phosphate-dependent enzyme [Rhodospirillaceae bacterium]